MWVWFCGYLLAAGITAGFVYSDSSGPNWAAVLGGLAGGAIAAIPALVVADLLVKILAAVQFRPVVQATEQFASSVSPPPMEHRTEHVAAGEHGTNLGREPHETGSREQAVGAISLDLLLDNSELVKSARTIRRTYGKDACASFLMRKASELGLGEIQLTAKDIPDTF